MVPHPPPHPRLGETKLPGMSTDPKIFGGLRTFLRSFVDSADLQAVKSLNVANASMTISGYVTGARLCDFEELAQGRPRPEPPSIRTWAMARSHRRAARKQTYKHIKTMMETN